MSGSICNARREFLSMMLASTLLPLMHSASANPDGVSPVQKTPVNGNASCRIMLFASKPSAVVITPINYVGQAQTPPGGSPGVTTAVNLIGALVVKGMQDSKARSAKMFSDQINAVFANYDFQKELAIHAAETLMQPGLMKEPIIESLSDPSDMEQPGLLVRVKEENVYTIDCISGFTPEFKRFQVVTTLRHWKRSNIAPEFSRRLRYISDDFRIDEGSRNLWLAEEGQRLLKVVRDGVAETMRMLVLAMKPFGAWDESPTPSVRMVSLDLWPGKLAPKEFSVVEENESRSLLITRGLPNEEFLSVTPAHIVY